MSTYSESFLPVIGKTAHILILGSLPGNVSLKKQQYYGNERNQFWQIIYTLFSEKLEIDYQKRLDFAIGHGIALWDVCHKAIRPGSLDSNIKEEIPNAIEALLNQHPSIDTIAFNGKKAAELYKKHLPEFQNITYLTLLSSSPANAMYSFEQKLENWKEICND